VDTGLRFATPWAHGIEIKTVVDTVHFCKSHHSRLIQLADAFARQFVFGIDLGTTCGVCEVFIDGSIQAASHKLESDITGVRINAVCPGLIETGMTKPVFDRAKERGTQDKIGQLNPLKRAGQPHELAAMGLFLASDEASYVNGQAIPVDGGLTASMPYAGKPI
jgi:hypothetical protein